MWRHKHNIKTIGNGGIIVELVFQLIIILISLNIFPMVGKEYLINDFYKLMSERQGL